MKIKKHIYLLLFFISNSVIAFSQCAMCKAVVESEMEGGGSAGKGINDGIIYLMIIPYILIGGVGYFIFKHYKKNNTPA